MPAVKKLDIEPFSRPFDEACAAAGHGRDAGYAKCKSGRWVSYIDSGSGKRMVTMDSLKADIKRSIAEQNGFTPAPFRGQPENPKRRPRKPVAAPEPAPSATP